MTGIVWNCVLKGDGHWQNIRLEKPLDARRGSKEAKRMKKITLLAIIGFMILMSFSAYADTTFSEVWKKDASGNWYAEGPDGKRITNAWLCDDAVPANGKNVWYLLDKSGNMVTAGLVQDKTGRYYSIETGHNGYFGMLRYKTGTYDGVSLTLDESHNGAFGAIVNPEGIEALKREYGVTDVSAIGNENCVYTSALIKTAGGEKSTSASSEDERLKFLREYYGMPDETEEVKNEKMRHVIFDLGRSYGDMTKTPLTYRFYYQFLTSTDWPNMSDYEKAEACFNAVCCDKNGSGMHGYGNGNYYQAGRSGSESYEESLVPAYHHGVCGDYAYALKYLLELVGISSETHQNQIGGMGHMVVRLSIGGTEYQLDPTNPHDKSEGFDANLYTLDDPYVLKCEW